MGLSARERRALRSLEVDLAVSAPRLAARLAVFTRLSVGEAFPAREIIRARRFDGAIRWPVLPLMWPVLWLVISIGLIATGFAVGHGGALSTCQAPATSCAWHAGGSPPW